MKARTETQPANLALPPLTAKQREVMALVADNRTSKEIAGLIGVSESAVNQRIEMIRARLGGIPRGEIARLYRQEYAPEQSVAAPFSPTWNKIQVQSVTPSGQSGTVEGPSGSAAAPRHRGSPGSGSQPSHSLLPAGLAWLGREELSATIIRTFLIGTLGMIGVAAAATITELVGFPSVNL